GAAPRGGIGLAAVAMSSMGMAASPAIVAPMKLVANAAGLRAGSTTNMSRVIDASWAAAVGLAANAGPGGGLGGGVKIPSWTCDRLMPAPSIWLSAACTSGV